VPYLHNHAAQAKEAAVKDNLRILREAIQSYAVHHGDTAPGYPGHDRAAGPTEDCFRLQLIIEENYLRKIPTNPFNGMDTVHIIGNNDAFSATGAYGWIYQPTTGNIRLDWPGQDGQGVAYLSY
jgi:hypothetical protein